MLLGAAATDAETPKPALTAARLAAAPVVDGDVREAEWAGSAVFDGRFLQLEPERGQPSPFRTIVRVGAASPGQRAQQVGNPGRSVSKVLEQLSPVGRAQLTVDDRHHLVVDMALADVAERLDDSAAFAPGRGHVAWGRAREDERPRSLGPGG